MQETFSTIALAKERKNVFPGAVVIFNVLFKTDNALCINKSFNVRHSQAAVLIITYECQTFNFIFTLSDQSVNNRIKFFDQFFRIGNERNAKHEFRYYKRLHDLDFTV